MVDKTENSTVNNFSWIPFYQELANKLLEYKDKRNDLLDIIYSLDNQYVHALHDGEKRFENIDPFSVFGIFNRGLSEENRIKICEFFKVKFGIAANVPKNFAGIPILNNLKSYFFFIRQEHQDRDISDLWSLFDVVLNGKDDFDKYFDIVQQHLGIKWNITMGLFWIKPYDYISLDERNRNYLRKQYNIEVSDDKRTATNYKELMQEIKTKMQNGEIKEHTFLDFSYEAWQFANHERPNYWLVGFNYGKSESQLEKFFKEEVWVGGFNIIKDKDQIKCVESIKVGDVLVLKSTFTKGKDHKLPCLRVSGIGIVEQTESAKHENEHYEISFDVNYISKQTKDFDGNTYGQYLKTIHKLNNKEIIDYLNSILEKHSPMNKIVKYITMLKANHNLILTGAPGTGKTYLAKQIAEAMNAEIDFVQFHPSYDYTDFVEGLRPTLPDENGNIGFERKDGVFKLFCKRAATIKPASFQNLYERLLQKIQSNEIDSFQQREGTPIGIKEVSGNNNIILQTIDSDSEKTYTVSYRRLKKLSEVFPNVESLKAIKNIDKEIRAVIGGCHSSGYWAALNTLWQSQMDTQTESSDKQFVFIIDEINRGEISKIFGELFFSIEPGYRGEKGIVKTQYNNLIGDGDIFKNGFYVPENVYIIGTMNDIDRSVESMDFAMRRRFAWYEISADESADNMNLPEESKMRMKRLNEAISKIKGLNSSYFIGGAYFLNLNNCDGDYSQLWENHLKGLLAEYLRGMTDADKILNTLKEAYDNENPSVNDTDN